MPRAATEAEVTQLASGTVIVALTGLRGRPLKEILLASGERVLPVYRTRAALEEASFELPLDGESGVAQGVAVDGVHALAHVTVAKLGGLVIDAGLLGSAFVAPDAARIAGARQPTRESRPPSAPMVQEEVARPADTSPPRVVIVDDDALVLRALERFLTMHGATVHTVSSALEAAAVVYLHRPTVVVLDVLMPGMDGERVWELLRGASPTPPRAVFYSGIGARELSAIAPGDPYVERVPKDAGTDVLLAAIQRAHALGRTR